MIRCGNTATSGETFRTSAEADLAAYEELPAAIRAAIRDAPQKIACEPLLAFWRGEGAGELDVRERFVAILTALETTA